MPVLIAVFLSWQATIVSTSTPKRETPSGRVYVRGEKARVELAGNVVIWDGRKLRLRAGTKAPVEMDPSLRAAFGIPPSCLTSCGYRQVGTDLVGGQPVRVFEKLFAKTPMGPLKQSLWLPAEGPPLRLEARSGRGITRMELTPEPGARISERLFRFAR